MLYNLINPSDTITFLAPDRKIAGLVCALVGNGHYCAQAYDADANRITAEDVPFFMFGGFEEFWAKSGDGKDMEGAVNRHLRAVIEALESFALVGVGDRPLYESRLASITDPKAREAFIAGWIDRKQTSLNGITGAAHALANELKAQEARAE